MTTDSAASTGTAPESARRKPVHVQRIDDFGTVTIVPVDPDRDVGLLHAWVTEERARFWGMGGADRARVHEIYAHLDSLSTHHAYLVHRDGEPAALFQTYLPQADPIGDFYDAQPGDLGVHLLIGPAAGAGEAGFTAALLSAFVGFVLADPDCHRVVVEPDARNTRAVDRLLRAGFVLGPQAELPDKRAQFAFLQLRPPRR